MPKQNIAIEPKLASLTPIGGDEIDVAFFDSAKDNTPNPERLTWSALVKRISQVHHTACGSHCPIKRCPHKDVGAFAGARFRRGGLRCKEDVEAKTLAEFDIDGVSPARFEACRTRLVMDGVRVAIVPTHSDRPNCRSVRVVFHPSRPVTPVEWPVLREVLKARYEIPADDAAADVARISFLASAPEGFDPAPPLVQDGPPLDVDDLLSGVEIPVIPERNERAEEPGRTELTPALRARAEAYIRAAGGGVLGKKGDKHAYKIAAWLQRDLNLSPDAAWEIMVDVYNPLCDPEWDLDELSVPFENGGRYGRHKPGAALAFDVRNYKRTDVGLAEMFRDQHKGRIRYVSALKRWLAWEGTCWVEDADTAMLLLVETVRSIYVHASRVEDQAMREDLVKFAIKSENVARLSAALKIAQSFEGIATRVDELDRAPMLLNVTNGTLDLRTGVLRPHDPADLITKRAPIVHDPAAMCPTFDKFLSRVVPSRELRTLIQRAFGYSLTGDVGEQVLFFLLGTGANGKTTLARVIQDMVGAYARPGAPDLLLAKQGESHPTEIAALRGARVVICSEIEESRHLAESRVKVLTGGDVISARGMHQDFYDIEPSWKIWQLANTKPRVRSGGPALWRRMVLVPFNEVIPEGERDPELGDKLRAEMSGILAWAVRGCLDWQQHGLPRPSEVTAAVETYEEEQDTVARFLEERCELHPNAWTASDELHNAYKIFCEMGGEFWKEKQAFTERLKASGLLAEKRGRRGWRGVRVASRQAQRNGLDTEDTETLDSRFFSHEAKS